MKLSNRSFTILLVAAVGLFCVSLIAYNKGWFKSKPQPVAQTDEESGTERDRDIPPHPGWVKIGDVWRPPTDVKPVRSRDHSANRRSEIDWGTSTPVAFEENANTKSLKEAVGKKDLAYRFSSMLPPPKFDRVAYQKDPQKYIDEVAPGRINQVLPASKDTVPIKRDGRYISRLIQGESVQLKAKVEPGMPVTFHSPKLGNFQNKLTSVTVRADENGAATATYTASGGTRGEIDIRAASPVHSDHARWVIEVVHPQQRPTSNSTPASKATPPSRSTPAVKGDQISQAK